MPRAKAKAKPAPVIRDEKTYVKELITRIVDQCPRRKPTSQDERRAHLMLKDEFENVGLQTHEEAFRFNENLYANMALHFGLGTLGTIVSGIAPALGLLLHTTAATSYWAESTRRAYILRRCFPWKPSQNLLGVLPAKGEPDLRIVIMGHADAAFTGLLFNPEIVKRFSGDLPPKLQFIKRSLALATRTQAALAGFDLLRCVFGPLTLPLRPLEALLTVPSALAFLLNLEVVLRNEIVPGANDNLSGCAALPVLAQRLAARKPDNVELVFVVTGCEEASLGGGDALACAKEGVWDKSKTVVIGLDGLTNGELKYLSVEGEVVATPIAHWLRELVDETAASETRFAQVTPFEVPVGGTDVAAFLAHDYEGVALVCVDPEPGSPRHYHLPADTPENLDMEQLMLSIDFAEKLVEQIITLRA